MTDLNAGDARRLLILHAVFEASGGKTSESIGVDTIQASITNSLGIDRDSLEDELALLMDRGHLDGFKSLAGLNDVSLTPRGKEVATQFAAARSDKPSRLRQLQDDYLRWLYNETEVEGRGPTPDDYLATSPAVLGVEYSAAELEKAGERLSQAALISGPGAWQYSAPLRPRLSAKGRHVVESGRSVHDVVAATPAIQNTYSTTVHGNANVANASSGVTQNLVVEDWGSRVTATLEAVTQSFAALPQEIGVALEPLIAEARAGVAQNEPGRARRALQAVGGFLGDSASGALGSVLGAQVLALLPLLGS